jgi:hypothetical protein
MYTSQCRQVFVLTGIVGLVRVLLALVEAGLLLLLGDLRVLVGSLVLGLVDTRVTDVGSSRHFD